MRLQEQGKTDQAKKDLGTNSILNSFCNYVWFVLFSFKALSLIVGIIIIGYVTF